MKYVECIFSESDNDVRFKEHEVTAETDKSVVVEIDLGYEKRSKRYKKDKLDKVEEYISGWSIASTSMTRKQLLEAIKEHYEQVSEQRKKAYEESVQQLKDMQDLIAQYKSEG